jgi:phosphoglycolate phosphatase
MRGPDGGAAAPHAAAIFDFEGTLVDFQWRLAPAQAELRRALAGLGLRGGVFEHGNYATLWNAAADLLEPQGRIAELRTALAPIYDRWDADALTRWAPRPGAVELLRAIATRGARAALVSNVGRRALAPALDRLGFTPWLTPIVTRDDVGRLKPRAEGIAHVLARWGIDDPGRVLFVGDSPADVAAAREAAMPVAIVRGGEGDAAAFSDAPPNFMITRLDELKARIGAG